MTMTNQYISRAANALPNGEPDLTTMTVDQIATHRGIGKRHAYSLLRRASEAKMDVPVPSNQRELILSILYRSDGNIRNTDDLSAAVHDVGSKLPPHDVTKVLWSLQKSQYVRFRERANGSLFAIKLTTEGLEAARRRASTEPEAEEQSPEPGPEPNEWPFPEENTVVETSLTTHPDLLIVALPWIQGSMDGYPVMRALRDRAIKAQKLNAAAKILEEAGEDDMVLAIMAKTEVTGLEAEVINLLRHFGEIAS